MITERRRNHEIRAGEREAVLSRKGPRHNTQLAACKTLKMLSAYRREAAESTRDLISGGCQIRRSGFIIHLSNWTNGDNSNLNRRIKPPDA